MSSNSNYSGSSYRQSLYRSANDRWLLGVCGGLGLYFNIDPILVRIAFILLLIFGGGGLFLYIILAVVIPREP